ncbi:MAG: 4Fe-4S dicluster domain-containing protein [Deltaproteobacteria bacterium]|nr:MAG: 4Fe-4S dicluster domain-containing protein [Deltaproteobacteria bacterium]
MRRPVVGVVQAVLLVKNRDGRPIKIEGNTESPLNRGAVCATGQATVLGLYDDERLKSPLWQGQSVTWEKIDQEVVKTLSDIKAQNGNIVILTSALPSPAAKALLKEWIQQYPTTEVVTYDAISSSALIEANRQSFGVEGVPHYHLEKAHVVVGINCDFLGTWISPMEFAWAYGERRNLRNDQNKVFLKHVQFETALSLTGSNADHRIPITPADESAIVLDLLKSVSKLASQSIDITVPHHGVARDEIESLARDLWKNRGHSLVISGSQELETQMAVNAINSLLGNIGETIDLDNISFQKEGQEKTLAALIQKMKSGGVQALILHGVNPAYTFSSEEFSKALKTVKLSISLSERLDETSSQTTAVCPDHYFLESWDLLEPVSSLLHVRQPVIRPLRDSRQAFESLLKWMGRSETYYEYLRTYAKNQYFGRQTSHLTFDGFWDRCVHDGVFQFSQTPSKSFAFNASLSTLSETVLQKQKRLTSQSLQLVCYEKISVRDGSVANNPWLQELPDPISKVSWDNYACLSPALAKSLFCEEGDVVKISTDQSSVVVPVHIQPGQALQTIGLALGYGRRQCGKVGEKVGVNAYPFLSSGNHASFFNAVTVEKTGDHVELACTQLHHSMDKAEGREERGILKEATLASFIKDPGNKKKEENVTLWEEKDYEGHHWGMVVDLTNCIGCSACVVSCQAENNVPVVGKDEVRRQREMHWIRIDRYFSGDENNPETSFQPMMCQHCGNAPCETVCPVLATVHSSDGLNQQVYNRCVGTRYCANNCPYKVRRFNWFDYAHNDRFDYNMNSDLGTMVLNPDIVVRSRGVMEKCSMCVQRIQEAKLAAKREGVPLKDGDIKLACEQSCPSQAIVFGNMNDPQSRVAQLQKDKRSYHVLEELNVKPVVSYLTKIRDQRD